MTTYILVFWLQIPSNFTEYQKYKTETECMSAVQLWQGRFNKVNSKLVAECRASNDKM